MEEKTNEEVNESASEITNIVVQKTKKERTISILCSMSLVLVVGAIIIQQVFQLSTVSGNSMYPTYESGQKVRANMFINRNALEHGQIITFYSGWLLISDKYIKRIIGVPGDKVQVIDGYVYVNNEKLDETYPKINDAGIAAEPIIVGEKEYFVMGDNRNNSTDSRVLGCIPTYKIIGIVEN